jgi:hypothetical protein
MVLPGYLENNYWNYHTMGKTHIYLSVFQSFWKNLILDIFNAFRERSI